MADNEWVLNDTLYHEVTLEDLKDPDFLEKIQESISDWLPNHMRDDRVDSYNDLIERLEGSFLMPDGRWVSLDLGNSYDSPVWKKLKSIAQKIVRESA